MPILFVSVSKGAMILARLSAGPGDLQEAAEGHLEEGPLAEGRRSLERRGHLAHLSTAGGVTCLVLTSRDYSRQMAFAFLDDVREQFDAVVTAKPREAAPYLFEEDMETPLANLVKVFNAPPDKVAAIRAQLKGVKSVLTQNIDELCERGERLQLLMDKTDSLEANSITFRTGATQLSRRMWWQNMRWWAVVAVVAVVVLYLVVAAACGWKWQCGSY